MLLAYIREGERERINATLVLKKIGPRTITDKQELKKELKEIVKGGHAVSEEELTEGAVAVAVPVFDLTNQVVAALTVNGPKFRMGQKQIENAIVVLKRAATKLSHKLPSALFGAMK